MNDLEACGRKRSAAEGEVLEESQGGVGDVF